MSYEEVTFSSLKGKRKEAVRETIAHMWANGHSATEISKKVRVGVRSVATALGNLTRSHCEKERTTKR